MKNQQVETVHGRLKTAVLKFVEDQRTAGKPNEVEALIQRAAKKVPGWTETTVKTWGGWRVRKTAEQLPQLARLCAFCDVTGWSADYILFGEGALMRETRKLGENIEREELARAIAAHLAPILRQESRGHVWLDHVDGLAALAVLEEAARKDLAETVAFEDGLTERRGFMTGLRELAQGAKLPAEIDEQVGKILDPGLRRMIKEDAQAREARASRAYPLVKTVFDMIQSLPRGRAGPVFIAGALRPLPAGAASLRPTARAPR